MFWSLSSKYEGYFRIDIMAFILDSRGPTSEGLDAIRMLWVRCCLLLVLCVDEYIMKTGPMHGWTWSMGRLLLMQNSIENWGPQERESIIITKHPIKLNCLLVHHIYSSWEDVDSWTCKHDFKKMLTFVRSAYDFCLKGNYENSPCFLDSS